MRETLARNPICPVEADAAETVRRATAAARRASSERVTSRGGGIRTRDLCVPNAALYQAELRPECSIERSHSMAVGADQLTFCDLLEDRFASKAAEDHVADLPKLGRPRHVIPVHGRVMKRAPTVGAWPVYLQLSVPAEKLPATSAALPEPVDTRARPVLRVVRPAALLAPCLSTTAPSMEVGVGFHDTTASASLLHVANMAIESDDAVMHSMAG